MTIAAARLAALLLMGIGAWTACSSGSGDNGSGGAFGRLVDQDGEPIRGATLWIPCPDSSCVTYSPTTQQSLNAQFEVGDDCPLPGTGGGGEPVDPKEVFSTVCTFDESFFTGGMFNDLEDGDFYGLICVSESGSSLTGVPVNVELPENGGSFAAGIEIDCDQDNQDVTLAGP